MRVAIVSCNVILHVQIHRLEVCNLRKPNVLDKPHMRSDCETQQKIVLLSQTARLDRSACNASTLWHQRQDIEVVSRSPGIKFNTVGSCFHNSWNQFLALSSCFHDPCNQSMCQYLQKASLQGSQSLLQRSRLAPQALSLRQCAAMASRVTPAFRAEFQKLLELRKVTANEHLQALLEWPAQAQMFLQGCKDQCGTLLGAQGESWMTALKPTQLPPQCLSHSQMWSRPEAAHKCFMHGACHYWQDSAGAP